MTLKHYDRLEYPASLVLEIEGVEIKSCPFCGGKAKIEYFTEESGTGNIMTVKCSRRYIEDGCEVTASVSEEGAKFGDSDDERTDRSVVDGLIMKWNKRSEAK